MAIRKCSGAVSARQAKSAGIRQEMKEAGTWKAPKKIKQFVLCPVCKEPTHFSNLLDQIMCPCCIKEGRS